MLALLKNTGFVGECNRWNIGHNQRRLTFMARKMTKDMREVAEGHGLFRNPRPSLPFPAEWVRRTPDATQASARALSGLSVERASSTSRRTFVTTNVARKWGSE